MANHGWGGNVPSSNTEAITRILDAADRLIAEQGDAMTLAEVARSVEVTRQTVYRYFPGTDALRMGCALRSADGFLEKLTARVGNDPNPLSAMVEGMAFAVEQLTATPHIAYLLSQESVAGRQPIVTEVALSFGLSLLHRFSIDWAQYGYAESDLNMLAEYCIRLLYSFLIDPDGSSKWTAEELRAFFARWMGPAILYPRLSDALRQIDVVQQGERRAYPDRIDSPKTR